MTTTADPRTLHEQAQAAEAQAVELRRAAAEAERAAHAERQRLRVAEFQGQLDTYSDEVNAKMVEAAKAKLMATDFFAALVAFIESRIYRGRAYALAEDCVHQGAIPRQPLPDKRYIPLVSDLYAEAAAMVSTLAADVAMANVEHRLAYVYERADEAYASVSGREPTHYKVTAVNRPGEDFAEHVGGEPVFFTAGAAILNALDPRLAYFRRAGVSEGAAAAYEVVGVFAASDTEVPGRVEADQAVPAPAADTIDTRRRRSPGEAVLG